MDREIVESQAVRLRAIHGWQTYLTTPYLCRLRMRLDAVAGSRRAVAIGPLARSPGALAFGHANDPVTHTPGYTIASLKNGSKVGVCLNWCSSSSQQHGHSQAIAMKTPMTALLV